MNKYKSQKKNQCVSHKGRVLVEAGLGELFEAFGEIPAERRSRRFRDVKQDSHGMHVRVRRFTLGELNGSNSQRPNVSLERHKQNQPNSS